MTLSWRLLLTSAFLVLVGQTPIVNPLRSKALEFASPLEYGAYSIAQSVLREGEFFLKLRGLKEENTVLRRKVEKLESELSKIKEIKREDKVLREQLDIGSDKGKVVMARVIGWPLEAKETGVLIDKGKKSGLKVGDVVILKTYLLGWVESATEKNALVRLITDPSSSASVLDQDSSTRTLGVVRGEFGTTLIMEHILPEEEIEIGDTIITSGRDGKFPKGLIVGKVEEVEDVAHKITKKARLKTLVDFRKLEEVFVIL